MKMAVFWVVAPQHYNPEDSHLQSEEDAEANDILLKVGPICADSATYHAKFLTGAPTVSTTSD
jgi:hypothetical protein